MPVLSHRRLDLVREGDQLAQGIERRQQLPAAKRFAAEHPRAADTDPDLTAVSHEAERAPEPGSTDPNKGPSAAEAAAAEAEASRASLEQYLPEEDRAQLHEALGRIDQEKLDQAEIIRAGAACASRRRWGSACRTSRLLAETNADGDRA